MRKSKYTYGLLVTLPLLALSFLLLANKGQDEEGNSNPANAKVVIETMYYLPQQVYETSGLVYFDSFLWTFNDSGGEPELFAFKLPDTSQAKRATLWSAYNFDWEDITQDSTHVYAGDIGNNFGNRGNLCIYRIKKSALLKHKNSAPKAEKISFTYPGYEPASLFSFNKSAYDCEAIVYANDSIYLFTKDWKNYRTTAYVIPAMPGKYKARKIFEFNSNGLITAADYAGKKLYLLGYKDGAVFLWIFDSLPGFLNQTDHGQRHSLKLIGGAQAEGIAIKDDSTLFISAEGGSSHPPRVWEMKLRTN